MLKYQPTPDGDEDAEPSQPATYFGLEFNPGYSLHSGIYPTVRPIEQLRWVRHTEDSDNPSYTFTSDVELLLNSERIINELGEDVYKMMVSSLSVPSMKYDPNKYSDDELLSTVKSRFIQTPSEMRAYLNACAERAAEYERAYKAAKEQAEAERLEALAQSQVNDPSAQSIPSNPQSSE